MEWLDSDLRPLCVLTGTEHLTSMLSRYIPGRRSVPASLPVPVRVGAKLYLDRPNQVT